MSAVYETMLMSINLLIMTISVEKVKKAEKRNSFMGKIPVEAD